MEEEATRKNCYHCFRTYQSYANLKRHLERCHASDHGNNCGYCGKHFRRTANMLLHTETCYRKCTWKPEYGATTTLLLGGALKMTRVPRHRTNFADLMEQIRNNIYALAPKIRDEVKTDKVIKIYCTVETTFIQNNDTNLITKPPVHLASYPSLVNRRTKIDTILAHMYQDVAKAVEKVELSGSSWQLYQVLNTELISGKYNPLTGGAIQWTYNVMDRFLLNNKYIALLDSRLQDCFMLCVREYFRDKYRVLLKKEHFDTSRNYSEPMKISDVPGFAANNGLSISLFGYNDERAVYPLLVSDSHVSDEHHIDMLYIYDKHFVLIYDFDSFISSACGSRVRKDRKRYHCRFCLMPYYSAKKLAVHRAECTLILPHVKTTYPKDKWLKYDKLQYQLFQDVTIYMDLETILDDDNKHVVLAFAYIIVAHVSDVEGGYFKPRMYFGSDAGEKLIHYLDWDYYHKIRPIMRRDYPIDMTPRTNALHYSTTHCNLCSQPLNWEDESTIARDHDHHEPTDNYRQTVHQACNLLLRQRKTQKVRCYLHNGSRYDFGLIIAQLNLNGGSKRKIQVLADTSEQFISWSYGPYIFLDSYRFLQCSLEKVVRNSDPKVFKIMDRFFGRRRSRMLQKKGVFPFNYVNKNGTTADKFVQRAALATGVAAAGTAATVGAAEVLFLGNESITVHGALAPGVEPSLKLQGRPFFRANATGDWWRPTAWGRYRQAVQGGNPNHIANARYNLRPHYHRRPITQPAGPGQGIGQHRPWQGGW